MLFCAEESNVWEMLGPVFMADLLETSVRHHPLIWIRSNHAEQDQVRIFGNENPDHDDPGESFYLLACIQIRNR